jgi:pilus assembly protein CpaF
MTDIAEFATTYRERLARMAGSLDPDPKARRVQVIAAVDRWLGTEECAAGGDHDRLLRALADELLGAGPLQALLDDDAVTEIMVNGPTDVYAEVDGLLRRTPIAFRDADHIHTVIERLLTGAGRRLDQGSPMVDARLADGTRLNAVLPPVAVGTPLLTLRRPPRRRLGVEELLELGSLHRGMAAFLHAAVLGRCNLLVSGGAGSGKTTLLAALCDLAPEGQRILVLEDVAELVLRHPHAVRQESRPAGPDGGREVTLADMVRNGLRMRPDRLIIGEVRGNEAADMVAAMNTGHEGSMTTLHANGPADALVRLETLLALAWRGQPGITTSTWIAAAIDLVVHCQRGADGGRWVAEIAAVEQGQTGDIAVTTLYRLDEHISHNGVLSAALGEVPRRCLERMARHGVLFPPALFARGQAA